MLRPRKSRMYYQGKYNDYPLRARTRCGTSGRRRHACGLSYVGRAPPPQGRVQLRGLARGPVRVAPVPDLLQDLYREGLGGAGVRYAGRLGGAAGQEPRARKAVLNAILPKQGQTEITTLIEEFRYPKYGPG